MPLRAHLRGVRHRDPRQGRPAGPPRRLRRPPRGGAVRPPGRASSIALTLWKEDLPTPRWTSDGLHGPVRQARPQAREARFELPGRLPEGGELAPVRSRPRRGAEASAWSPSVSPTEAGQAGTRAARPPALAGRPAACGAAFRDRLASDWPPAGRRVRPDPEPEPTGCCRRRPGIRMPGLSVGAPSRNPPGNRNYGSANFPARPVARAARGAAPRGRPPTGTRKPDAARDPSRGLPGRRPHRGLVPPVRTPDMDGAFLRQRGRGELRPPAQRRGGADPHRPHRGRTAGDHVEDCPVCCRPNEIHVEPDLADGHELLLEQPGRIAHRGRQLRPPSRPQLVKTSPGTSRRTVGAPPLRAPHHPRLQPPGVRPSARWSSTWTGFARHPSPGPSMARA